MAVKTGFDLVDTLCDFLEAQSFDITGKVYPFSRPVNSDKEDLVVNSLTLDNEQLQTGFTNINGYVPGKRITVNDITESMPDVPRMQALAASVASTIKKPVYLGEYEFWMQQPPVLIGEQQTGAFFFNIRVQWNNLNF